MSCKDIELLLATERELTPGQTQLVRQHLPQCARCREAGRRVSSASQTLQRLPHPSAQAAGRLLEQVRLEPCLQQAPAWRGAWRRPALATLALLLCLALAGPYLGWPFASVPASTGTTATPVVTATALQPTETIIASSEPVTLTLGTLITDRADQFTEQIQQFEQEHPHIHVEILPIETISDESFEGIMTHMANNADLIFDAQSMPQHLLLDVKPLLEADLDFDRADFFPALWQDTAQIYRIPESADYHMLGYNKMSWQEAGLPTPSPEWTWNDVLQAARQLVRKDGEQITRYGLFEDGQLNSFLMTKFEQIQSSYALLGMSRKQISLPEYRQLLQETVGLAEQGVIFIPENDNAEAGTVRIVHDKIGIWRSPHPAEQSPKPEFGTLPYPSDATNDFGTFRLGFEISANSRHPREAWELLAFLSKRVQQRIYGPGAFPHDIPARRSAAEQSGAWQAFNAEQTVALTTILNRPAKPQVFTSFVNESFDAFWQALQAVIFQGQAPAEALSAAQQRINSETVYRNEGGVIRR